MSIQYTFFTIPIHEAQSMEEELNRFLRTVKVVQVQRQFVQQKEFSYWALAVEYVAGGINGSEAGNGFKKKKIIDYKEVLSPDDFKVFSRLREWRKAKAVDEGVPVYTIFTNEQLSKIVVNRVKTMAELNEIEGVGENRINTYGEDVLIRVESAFQDLGQETKD